MKLGIDMGGMSIKMGLVNEENKIIGRITIPTDLTVPYQTLVERMADAVRQMLENAGMTLEQCGGIGIGSPGTIDAKQGVILIATTCPSSIKTRLSFFSISSMQSCTVICSKFILIPPFPAEIGRAHV